jgi:hypothetical protein|tara:strand:+ start:992 stop:1138 length:147 start_codon:yes stop_codon:yes gene_type:complete
MDWFGITFWVYMVASFAGFVVMASSILELERRILEMECKSSCHKEREF